MGEIKPDTNVDNNWRFPDFIIAGAMKCGTTSLHKILDHHPDVFIPDREIHFFDIDDIKQHPDFFQNYQGEWFYPRFNNNLRKYLDWYADFFSAAEPGQLIGEDSTTYIASDKAAERIAKLNPNVKIVVMLRDPASRTYSHYWHIVRSGRALWSFEKMLQIMPDNLIQRSLYKKQIEMFLKYLPRDHMHFVVLENFARNTSLEVEKVCRFIGVDPGFIDLDNIKTHGNPAKIPKNPALQLWRNRLMRLKARKIYLQHLIDLPDPRNVPSNALIDWMDQLHRKINPLQKSRPPQMQAATRKFLDDYYHEANKGLEDLIGQETKYWYRSKTN